VLFDPAHQMMGFRVGAVCVEVRAILLDDEYALAQLHESIQIID
jgi:hypothetical protein